MCGRFTINLTYNELEDYVRETYHIEEMKKFNVPNYNVAPGTEIISILNDGMKFRIGTLKWGFIPSFSKDTSFQLINIKAESLFTKSMFKDAALHKRCVVLADSFYEWDSEKQPFRILVDNQRIFKMAAIWSTFTTQSGEKVHTVGIITKEANPFMKEIHERMPVILNDKDEGNWLNPSIQDEKSLIEILYPKSDVPLHKYKVSKQVNSPTFNSFACIEELKQ
jgi:putative SOS response-associated peptidase YedK